MPELVAKDSAVPCFIFLKSLFTISDLTNSVVYQFRDKMEQVLIWLYNSHVAHLQMIYTIDKQNIRVLTVWC